MNQAELPCGTAIKVEPSDPLYKLRKKKSDRPHEMAADGTQGQSLEQPLGSDPKHLPQEARMMIQKNWMISLHPC